MAIGLCLVIETQTVDTRDCGLPNARVRVFITGTHTSLRATAAQRRLLAMRPVVPPRRLEDLLSANNDLDRSDRDFADLGINQKANVIAWHDKVLGAGDEFRAPLVSVCVCVCVLLVDVCGEA